MNLRQMKISHRLSLSSGIVVAAILLMAATVLWNVQVMRDRVEDLTGTRMPLLREVAELRDHVNEQARAVRNMLLFPDEASVREEKARILTSRTEVSATLQKIGGLVRSEQGLALFAKVKEDREEFRGSVDRLFEKMDARQKADAAAYLAGDFDRVQRTYFASLKALNDDQAQLSEASSDSAEDAASVIERTVWIATVLVVLLATLLAWWAVRAIVAPIGEAVRVARGVAGGDLSQKLEGGGDNETGQLLTALRDMQNHLVSAVSGVRSGAEGVATSSAQIASGNNDLSSRTEQQASALEQTASSMEQLSSTVKQNADNARQANALAQNASAVAVQGGDVVNEVVETMRGINDSSKKIAEIIGTIDGIAFQTNILALNAAVEAARAGEQGRGFAVVASEVRSLAQRSAEAAKQIKTLIGASVERVDLGTALVDKAGVTMTEVVQSIRRVTDIMGEISSASIEQSQGVAQVGEAVAQMDQATQQNAALVEESAAAAESLRTQARQLVQSVAVFKLAAGSPADTAIVAAAKPAPAAGRPAAAVERRGSDRAVNVSRLPARAARPSAPAPAPVPAPAPAPASSSTGVSGSSALPAAAMPVATATATGTGDWTSF